MFEQWLVSLAGGVLIGSGALLLYAASGRIAGISGIGYGLIGGAPDQGWRWLFLGGLIGGGALAALISGLAAEAPRYSAAGALNLIGAGLLVGIGTRLGNGCTSGHGVCGLARLSPRSLAATLVFMALGMATATTLHALTGA